MMRVASVFIFTLICALIVFYGLCAFVTAVPNPMDWEPVGRFLYCFVGGGAGVLLGLAAVMAYEEHYG